MGRAPVVLVMGPTGTRDDMRDVVKATIIATLSGVATGLIAWAYEELKERRKRR
jgi:hypothetical protein